MMTKDPHSSPLTGRQAARLRALESIVSGSGAVVFRWRVAEGWPVEFVTENVQQLLGYTAEDFMSGRVSWPGITHPDDVPRLEVEVAGLLKQGITDFSQEYRLFTKTGKIRWVADRNVAVMNSKGDITHVQGIVFDVSDRRRLERELLKATSRQRQHLGDTLRETFAQELAGARFLALSLEKELSETVLPPSISPQKIASAISDSLRKALTIMRGLSLTGVEDEGLAFGLEQLASAVRHLFGVSCKCVVGKPVISCDEAQAVQIYDIAEEAVDLAIRRGKAKHVTIRLSPKPPKAMLTIEHDGAPVFDETRNVEARLIRCRAEMIAASLDVKQDVRGQTTVTCCFDPRRRVVLPSAEKDPLAHVNKGPGL